MVLRAFKDVHQLHETRPGKLEDSMLPMLQENEGLTKLFLGPHRIVPIFGGYVSVRVSEIGLGN
jgi:hypothetical protein